MDGHKIASEAQRQLYDDVKCGNCTRCHKRGHNRKDCKEPKAKWKEKFDKEKLLYWTSVQKWQQRATQPSGTGPTDPFKPSTLHIKPEKRFNTLLSESVSDDSDDPYTPLYHYRMTMPDPDDKDDYEDSEDSETFTVPDELKAVAPTLSVAAILADVDQQLTHYPVNNGDNDVVMSSAEDDQNLERMDAHVRAILAGAEPRLFVLNSALGHNLSPPPLTDDSITAHIAEIYAYYYGSDTSDDEIPEPLPHHRPPTPPQVPAIIADVEARLATVDPATLALAHYPYPFSTLATLVADPFFTTILRDSEFSVVRFPSGRLSTCLTYDLDRVRAGYLSPAAPVSRPSRRPPTPRFVPESPPQESSSVLAPTHDDITYALSTASLLPSRSSTPTPIMPTPTTRPPLPHLGLPDVPWGSDPPHVVAPHVQQGWQMPQWSNDEDPHGPGPEPEPEPPSWGFRRSPSPSPSDSHRRR